MAGHRAAAIYGLRAPLMFRKRRPLWQLRHCNSGKGYPRHPEHDPTVYLMSNRCAWILFRWATSEWSHQGCLGGGGTIPRWAS